jgi:hypothetical protein
MRIPLIDGREFTDRDDGRASRVAVINEVMAKRFWPAQNPIGRKFKADGTEWAVVGIAKTGKYRLLTEPATCFFYVPYAQWPYSDTIALCLRTTGDPASLAEVVRRELQRSSPGSRIWATMTMTDYIQAAFVAHQITSGLLVLLGMVVVALAAMGVYGVMAYVVVQRSHEFGIRIALGAGARDILRMLLGRGLVLASIGSGIGTVLALAITRLLSNFLYGVSPFDAFTFAGAPLLLAVVTILASWLPARRAARVDPMVALRAE